MNICRTLVWATRGVDELLSYFQSDAETIKHCFAFFEADLSSTVVIFSAWIEGGCDQRVIGELHWMLDCDFSWPLQIYHFA